jgi:2'-5' RNA ligase
MADELRLFFALWPDEATRAALTRAMPVLGPGGRAIPADNLHATLAFLGGIATKRLPALYAVADGIRGEPFILTLDRYEIWNHTLVALVPTQTPAALEQLARDLTAGLGAAGFPTETRPYRAHVTLIRERRRGDGRRAGLVAPHALSDRIEPIAWRIDEFALVCSQRSPGGSRYDVLRRWRICTNAAAH